MSATLSVQELTTAPTEDQIFNQMILWLVAMNIPADKWRAGGVARSILRVVARTHLTFAQLVADIAAAGFLETATGSWLTLLAQWVYGVTRITATYASGTWMATNSGGGTYVINPGDLVVQDLTTNATYDNRNQVGPVTLNPGGVYGFTITATAVGTPSNANPGDISKMVTNLPGVTGSNASAVLAQDDENDSDLRASCLAKLSALSMNGPRGAYAYAVRAATNNGAPVNVSRKSISPSSSTGGVTIYLASPSGPVTAGDITGVQAAIEQWSRPDSVTATVASAVAKAYSATITVWARTTTGLDSTTLSGLVSTALSNYIAAYDVGGLPKPPSTQGYLYAEALEAAAQQAHSAIYAVDSSAGDLALNPGEVAVLTTTIVIRFTTTAST